MKLRIAAFAACVVACGGSTVSLGGGADAQKGGDASTTAVSDVPSFDDPGFPTLSRSSKVDILFAVDNSAGMGVKAELMARSVRTFLDHVVVLSSDVHVGVVTSSLGNAGGDVCPADNPAANTRALLQRTGPNGNVVASDGVLTLTSRPTIDAFEDNVQALIRGVGQSGCGLEAQLESVYRFLVQPDPYDAVRLDSFKLADLGQGVDIEVLQQRKAFLRPDSLLVVIMLTDEDDSSPDPRSVGGFGYAFASRSFPGSNVQRGTAAQGTTAPRATSICALDPGSADCTSCGFAAACDASTVPCLKIRRDESCTTSGVPGRSGAGYDGFYGPGDDDLNVRFHRMKERYGVDPQFPVDRYVAGFSASSVPDRGSEHVETISRVGQRTIAEYTYRRKCTNPIFASSLPSGVGDELCALPRGPRSPELVVFGVLGGVPRQLVDTSSVNWNSIVGADPAHYDFSGIDPHMVQSILPRAGLASGGDASSPRGQNGTDPVDGREWNTANRDLQYACTFALEVPLVCATNADSCDCADPGVGGRSGVDNPPLCAADGSPTQIRGKAYPSVRELRVAQKLGSRAMIGSVCAASPTEAYTPFLDRFEGVVLPRIVPN